MINMFIILGRRVRRAKLVLGTAPDAAAVVGVRIRGLGRVRRRQCVVAFRGIYDLYVTYIHIYVRPLDMIQKRSEKCAAASYALTLKPFTLERRRGP